MAPRRKIHVVFALTPLPGWRPSSPWAFPPEATAAKLLGRYATPSEAAAVCRVANKAQMQRVYHRQPVDTWLVTALCVRPRHEAQKGQGGVA